MKQTELHLHTYRMGDDNSEGINFNDPRFVADMVLKDRTLSLIFMEAADDDKGDLYKHDMMISMLALAEDLQATRVHVAANRGADIMMLGLHGYDLARKKDARNFAAHVEFNLHQGVGGELPKALYEGILQCLYTGNEQYDSPQPDPTAPERIYTFVRKGFEAYRKAVNIVLDCTPAPTMAFNADGGCAVALPSAPVIFAMDLADRRKKCMEQEVKAAIIAASRRSISCQRARPM